jgi:hypothetical protein
MDEFKTGDVVIYARHPSNPFMKNSCPIGSKAIVIQPLYIGHQGVEYMNVSWIEREKFGNHNQSDGGYCPDNFDLFVKPEEKKMEFIPGKNYINDCNVLNRFVGYDYCNKKVWQILGETKSAGNIWIQTNEQAFKWTEYKEPVVHKRYVHWMKNKRSGDIVVSTTKTSTPLSWYNHANLHTQEVTYTEKPTEG